MLEEEYQAHKSMNWDGEVKDKDRRLSDYKIAVRVNCQLAFVLQAQGPTKMPHVLLIVRRNFSVSSCDDSESSDNTPSQGYSIYL